MSVTIEVLDPADHGAYTEFYEVYARANDRPYDQPWSAEELLVSLVGDEYRRQDALVAREGETVVGVALAELPERDNVDTAFAEVWVPAELRRRGHGTALLERLEQRIAEDGRTQVLTETLRGVGDETSSGREFMLARGYRPDTMNVQRELALPWTPQEVDLRDGYTLRAWRGLPPGDWLDQYAHLRALLNQEAPSGETQLENEYWDADRLRLEVDQWKRQRRTLVLPEHRGHGLGLALKQQAMLEAADLLEGRARIVTWNDAQNHHMIAVNESLGYRATAYADQCARSRRSRGACGHTVVDSVEPAPWPSPGP